MISYTDGTTGVLDFSIRADFSQILAVLLGLFLFGVLYNLWVEYLINRKYVEGYMSLVVAGGVGLTLIGLAILSWQLTVMAILGFTASGIPMIIGSFVRYIRMRARDQQSLLESVQLRSQKSYPHGLVFDKQSDLEEYVERCR
ncbi:MAG: hypothetical protein CVU46_10595 [Chloroflexi bacterium HGW-Chloroflexi-8]|nr:MAG: hypothetical protein CVU46_10595 [Chloroflexi bacterium HGW-Chloroflexi-8]